MAALNRFFMVLIALLAIAAAVMSYMLFERRGEFRDRADLLAQNTAAMVKSLDAGSDTNVARKVTFTPGDPAAGIQESGSLSWADFHNDRPEYAGFKSNLKAAAELAKQINNQRNHLAETILQIGFDLQMPVDAFNAEDLKKAAEAGTYTNACRQVLGLAKATSARTDDMIRTVVSAANTIGQTIDDSEFRARDAVMDDTGSTVLGAFKHRRQLDDFNTAVVSLNTRAVAYADAIGRAIEAVNEHNWNTDPELVRNRRGYDRALITMGNDLAEINLELRRSKERKVMVEKLTTDLTAAKDELAKVKNDRDELQARANDLNIRVKELEKLIAGSGSGGQQRRQDFPLPDNLQGRVLQVNRDWNFVILNLGEQEVYEALPMLVARNDKFIGRVRITKVAKNISVAEIDADLARNVIQEGDLVILPRKEL